jgi:hypothetical protein
VAADCGDRAWVVVVVRREYRALGRELRYSPVLRRRSLLGRVLGWVLRHLPEILLVVLLVRLWQVTASRSDHCGLTSSPSRLWWGWCGGGARGGG